jgi:hypothetical protein
MAISECDGLLQQFYVHMEQLSRRTRNNESIDSNRPSEEETQVMHAKWQMFLRDVEDVQMLGHKIAYEISMPTL